MTFANISTIERNSAWITTSRSSSEFHFCV